MPSLLFVCVANSCRSQMAEAAARRFDRDGRWDVWSAGSRPGGGVHPAAVDSMRELGMDISGRRSKGLSDVPQRTWDYVVTMGCGDTCPAVRAAQRLDWQIPDPVGLPPDEFRAVRDDLIRRVEQLMASAASGKPAGPRPA